MLSQIIKRFLRAPVTALGVVLLAAVLSGSLCALNAANIAEQARYQDTVKNVEVKLMVTNLSGTRYDALEMPNWALDVFTSRLVKNGLHEYVENVQVRRIQKLHYFAYMADPSNVIFQDAYLVGLTGLDVAPELGDMGITWFGENDASAFGTVRQVCVIPEELLPEGHNGRPFNITVNFEYTEWEYPSYTSRELSVIGTHNAGDNIYCTGAVAESIQRELSSREGIDSIQATLIDNSMIGEVRELSKNWFAEPNPTGAKTPWDYSYYFYYPLALKIDDSQLVNAERTLKISLLINELCAVLVFALSAGASFFVGFLMIRSRKREIALMRTLGTPVVSVFLNFALEQLLCLAAGTAIGGGFFGFEPPERLAIFAGVYFAGLCISLVIFLGKNLMTTLKEDE